MSKILRCMYGNYVDFTQIMLVDYGHTALMLDTKFKTTPVEAWGGPVLPDVYGGSEPPLCMHP